MKKSILQSIVRIAREKLSDHPELEHFPHYSFVIQNNRVVEWATNVNHIPPVHYGYKKIGDDSFKSKFHAEIFAWKKARGLLNGESFEIINLRLNKKGSLRLSKPCEACYSLMCELGCKKFYYSADIGFLELK